METKTQCRICGNDEGNKPYVVQEMQFGSREKFDYFECDHCGCLQIAEVPEDLSRHYPSNYFSFQNVEPTVAYSKPGLPGFKQRLISRQLTQHYFRQRTLLGEWLAQRSSMSGDYPLWVRDKSLNLGLTPDSQILDVGCGKGQLLLDLHELGFTNLLGIDPFLEADITYDNGVRVLKKNLIELDQQFQFIMLHHSFEHMPDQIGTLKTLKQLLGPEGFVLIRIPIAGSYCWRKYGVHWAALDAPRHIFLHTPKSLGLIASKMGFDIAEVVYDAEGYSHWASEQYRMGIPLMDDRSYKINASLSPFTREQIAAFIALDAQLNASGQADIAAFFLRQQ